MAEAAAPLSAPMQGVASKQATMLSITWRHFRHHRLAVFGSVVLLLLMAGAILLPLLSDYQEGATHILDKYQPPSLEHPMGTDGLGRDILMRAMYGGRFSLMIGLSAMALAIGLGTLVGALAGFYGGWLYNILMRVADIMLTLPTL